MKLGPVVIGLEGETRQRLRGWLGMDGRGQKNGHDRGAPGRVVKPAPLSQNGAAANVAERARLQAEVAQVSEWYHTLELPHGVVTPGRFDHRLALQHYHLPPRLDGQRVLDVATYDGFWAFEFERRGAAETVAIDLAYFSEADHPPSVRARMRAAGDAATGAGFGVAQRALASRVQRKILSVYELAPEQAGLFDFVFCGDLLLHLRDPMLALQRIRSVTRGSALFVDVVDPTLSGAGSDVVRYASGYEDCVWWFFAPETLARMVRDAGFARVESYGLVRLDYADGSEGPWRLILRAFADEQGR